LTAIIYAWVIMLYCYLFERIDLSQI
jgi:hypothetical protein